MVIDFGLVFQLDNQISYLYEELIYDKLKNKIMQFKSRGIGPSRPIDELT